MTTVFFPHPFFGQNYSCINPISWNLLLSTKGLVTRLSLRLCSSILEGFGNHYFSLHDKLMPMVWCHNLGELFHILPEVVTASRYDRLLLPFVVLFECDNTVSHLRYQFSPLYCHNHPSSNGVLWATFSNIVAKYGSYAWKIFGDFSRVCGRFLL